MDRSEMVVRSPFSNTLWYRGVPFDFDPMPQQLQNLHAHWHVRQLTCRVTASCGALEPALWQKLIDRFAQSLERWGYAQLDPLPRAWP